jgi:hypothetical protein
MVQTTDRMNIPNGTDVYGSEGDKVGRVIEAYSTYVVVEKGFFFPTDYYIPTDAFASFDGGRAYLKVTKDEAQHRGWDVEPTEISTYSFDASGTANYAAAREGRPSDMSAAAASDATAGASAALGTTGHMGESPTSPGLAGDLTKDRTRTAATAGTQKADDAARVPVREEEPTATKRPVEQGQVRIEKDVATEHADNPA